MIASRLVWLPSVTTRSNLPCRLSAFRRTRFAAARLRRSLNQQWNADISDVWTREGWLCLAVVLDLFARRVVGWAEE
jgi:transposase InsO family protein